ncbi:hypothetical protein [Aeromonas media]
MTEKRPTLDELLEQLDESRVDVDWRSDDSDDSEHVPPAPLAEVNPDEK